MRSNNNEPTAKSTQVKFAKLLLAVPPLILIRHTTKNEVQQLNQPMA
jgi:hypothetical protein